VLCEIADRPGMSRNARKNLLADNGYGSLNEGTISRLLRMAEHEPAIIVWRSEKLTERQRETWNSPTSICNRCPEVRKAIVEANKNKPPRQPKKKTAKEVGAQVEKALDTLSDALHVTEDADHRAAIVERLTALVQHFAAPTTPKPKPKPKPERKREVNDEDEAAKPAARPAAPMLHAPKMDVRSRAMCGPTAIAAVTGEPVSVIRDTIRAVTGKVRRSDGSAHPVMGMHSPDLLTAMDHLGFKVAETEGNTVRGRGTPISRDGRALTLGRFVDERGHDGPFILSGGMHFFAVSAGKICDTFTKVPVDIASFDRDRKKLGRKTQLKAWWRFEKV
jgi:hypothetical protein